MTPAEVIATCERVGITLSVNGEKLRYEAPAGALTPVLREQLLTHKGALLKICWRLVEMRRLAGTAPRPCVYARESAQGAPGICFSCGDPLDGAWHVGRCWACDIAADVYYATRTSEVCNPQGGNHD